MTTLLPTSRPFGQMPDGRPVELFTLRNRACVEADVMTRGGTIVSLRTPDRTGALDDITLGFDTLAEYLSARPFFGCLVGRYGNRIAKGRFTLDGREYVLATNNGPNHLHGGNAGWDRAVWQATPFAHASGAGLRLRHTSPDGDEGYPGNVEATVTYTLADANAFIIDYEAVTDAPTVINLTQHAYFNLAGTRTNDVLGHVVELHADQYTPVDETLIPTGDLAPVAGTPFDFRTPVAIGARIDAPDEQLRRGHGYDHNFVVRRGAGASPVPTARVVDPGSGRVLEVTTTEPGVQFYSGNFLNDVSGKGGRVYGPRSGFCLETQHYPDSPNHSNFPSTVLRPGQVFRSRTVFRFDVRA